MNSGHPGRRSEIKKASGALFIIHHVCFKVVVQRML
jgi:hypothetical protein